MAQRAKNMRQLLIEAGIGEINREGVSDFSVRRVAQACGVSCAAPYKHFKDRRDFIAAIIQYVNEQWEERQARILASCTGDLREQIVETAVGYLCFVMEKPWFRSILMLKDAEFDTVHQKVRGQMSNGCKSLYAQFLEESGWDEAKIRRKLHVCRALLYGTVFLIDSEELAYDEETIANVRAAVEREFDLP